MAASLYIVTKKGLREVREEKRWSGRKRRYLVAVNVSTPNP